MHILEHQQRQNHQPALLQQWPLCPKLGFEAAPQLAAVEARLAEEACKQSGRCVGTLLLSRMHAGPDWDLTWDLIWVLTPANPQGASANGKSRQCQRGRFIATHDAAVTPSSQPPPPQAATAQTLPPTLGRLLRRAKRLRDPTAIEKGAVGIGQAAAFLLPVPPRLEPLHCAASRLQQTLQHPRAPKQQTVRQPCAEAKGGGPRRGGGKGAAEMHSRHQEFETTASHKAQNYECRHPHLT